MVLVEVFLETGHWVSSKIGSRQKGQSRDLSRPSSFFYKCLLRECSTRKFKSTITLPHKVDRNVVKANLKNGTLTDVLPKQVKREWEEEGLGLTTSNWLCVHTWHSGANHFIVLWAVSTSMAHTRVSGMVSRGIMVRIALLFHGWWFYACLLVYIERLRTCLHCGLQSVQGEEQDWRVLVLNGLRDLPSWAGSV